MNAPDLSEHFGRGGEFIIGLIGLLVLALMHKDVRRFFMRLLTTLGKLSLRSHAALCRRSSFYKDWLRSFRLLFRERRELFILTAMLIAFDYLANWHAAFMHAQLDLAPAYSSDNAVGILMETLFSAQTALGILRTFGYALFCWIAFQVASGASYLTAAKFQPILKLIGLFLMIYGVEFISAAISPFNILFARTIIQDPLTMTFTAFNALVGLFFCYLGMKLFKGRVLENTVISALIGYVILTHILQWHYHWTYFANAHYAPLIVTLTSHINRLTYTLLGNVALIAFAIRLSGPPRSQMPANSPSHHAANAI